jgi:polysaccharide biosynthesis protein PslH
MSYLLLRCVTSVINLIPNYQSVKVIPNSINLSEYSNAHKVRSPFELLFTGSFRYSANYKAIVWFLSDVYPKIKEKVIEIHLTVTGDHMNLPIPPAEDVTLTGLISDIHNRISRASICIVPLTEGGGTRLKILEAMALSTPVVSTSIGAEGLEVENEKHLLIADTPDDFADAVIRLLTDETLRARLTNQACSLVEEKYNSEIITTKYLKIIEKIIEPYQSILD